MRAFCPLVLWSICCAAGAQPVDPGLLRPLDQGNRWEYAVLWTGTDADSVRSIEVFEVNGDTTLDGVRRAVLHGSTYDTLQRETGRWRCFVPYDAPHPDAERPEGYGCLAQTPVQPIDASSAYVAPGSTISVGANDYAVEAIVGYDYYLQLTGGSGGGYSLRATSLLGVHEFTTHSRAHINLGGASRRTVRTLHYAVIGAEEFGEPLLTDPEEIDWARFSPLNVGNQWLYSVHSVDPSPPAPAPYFSFEIEADTAIANVNHRVLVGKILDADLRETHTYRWAFHLDSEGRTTRLVPFDESPEMYALPVLSRAYPARGVYRPSTTIIAFHQRQTIGTRIHDIDAVAVYRATFDERPDLYGAVYRSLLADIGTLTHRFVTYGSIEDSGSWEARLEFAQVGGRIYGRVPADDLTSNPLRISAAYPNPFDRHLQLEIETDDPQGLHAALFDMLGRKVAERELASSNLASVHFAEVGVAGAYLLVITDRHGRSASRRLIHLPGHGAR